MTLSMRLRHVGIVEWVDVIPLIVGGLGTVSKNFEMWLEKIKVGGIIAALQKRANWELQVSSERCWTPEA